LAAPARDGVYVARVISRAEAQSFDRVAADYDRLGDLDRRDWMEPWLAAVLPDRGQRALELGCGSGRQAVTLASRFGQVDAIDLSGAMIGLARARRSRPNISYRQADLLELDEGGYDFILSGGGGDMGCAAVTHG